MRPALLLASLPAIAACSASSAQHVSASPGPEQAPSSDRQNDDSEAMRPRLSSTLVPAAYELSLTILPDEPRFSGSVKIAARLDEARSTLWMHGRGLAVRSAKVTLEDGTSLAAEYSEVGEDGVARLRLPRSVGPGKITIAVEWDAPFDDKNDALFRVSEGGEWYAFTQFEATMARRCFPSFDEPAFKTPFQVTLTVAREHAAVGNSPIAEETPIGGGKKRIRFLPTEPIPTYLVAFAVGPLDLVAAPDVPPNALRARPLPLRGIAAKKKGEKLGYALRKAPELIGILESYFGTPYPFEKLDLIAVPGFIGAMENAGAITFREWHLMLDETRAPVDQLHAYAYVVAHEVAHHWFGNLVTMPWWDDLWLNEAFATWMEYRAVHDFAPAYRANLLQVEDAIYAMDADSLISARQIRQPVLSQDDITNAFDGITYSKGGAVLTMFERYIGPEVFRRGVRRYLGKHRFASATADDFLAAISEEAGTELAGPFETFLLQPGVPHVDVRPSCLDGRTTKATVAQSRFLPLGSRGDPRRLWKLPLCMKLRVGGEIRRKCAIITGETTEVELAKDGCARWVMPNADAAGYYRWTLQDANYAALLTARDELDAREQLSIADSVMAGYGSGRISAAKAFERLAPFALSRDREVARAPMQLLSGAKDRVVPAALVPALEAYARALYEKPLARLGMDAAPGTRDAEIALSRRDLYAFLAKTGRHAGVRDMLERSGLAYIGFGGDGRIHPEAVAADLAELALGIALQESDAAVFDALVTLLRETTEPVLRRQILGALGAATDPPLARRVRALLLDPDLRSDDVYQLLFSHVEERENRAPTWAWLKEHFDALRARLSDDLAAELIQVPATLCQNDALEDVRAFFQSRVDGLAGGPRQLASAIERIELCLAERKAQQPSAEQFFERTPAPRTRRNEP